MLTPDNHIYTVDRDRLVLERVCQQAGTRTFSPSLTTLHADFTRPLHLPSMDGIPPANALHFAAYKQPVLAQLASLLKPGGKLVVVENNTRQGNYAVPIPRDEGDFLALVRSVGLEAGQIVVRAPPPFWVRCSLTWLALRLWAPLRGCDDW